MGILFQSNFASITGYYGHAAKVTVKKMLKNNLVSFLGSDVHRPETIYKLLPKALKKIGKIVSEDYLEDLTTNNAELVLRNEYID